jgi:hypothetical protein
MEIHEITKTAQPPPPEIAAPSLTGLPHHAIASPRYAQAEDRAIWTSGWVCLGDSHTIPGTGDILPYTLGNQGIHVQHLGDAQFAARFNKVPHGGCRFVPLQCQTGTKTKCTFTACGYSRDRGVLRDDDDAAHQYLGLRPERLLQIPVATIGPLIFVNLGEATEPPKIPALKGDFQSEVWAEYAGNWKEFPARLFGRAPAAAASGQLTAAIELAGERLALHWTFPNLIVIQGKDSHCAIVVQPTALQLTMARISAYGARRDWGRTIRDLRAQPIDPQTDAAIFLRGMIDLKMDGAE